MTSCCATIGSVTYALKGQRLLADYNINSKVIKVRSQSASSGCAYGIEFDCVNTDTVSALLKRGSVPFTDMFRM